MASKKLIVVVEGTAAIGAFWPTIISDYLEKIIRCFCGNEPSSQKLSTNIVELSLVIFNTHGPYSACLVQRSGWTRNMDLFLQWLSALSFSGGGFNNAAVAEGLAEALVAYVQIMSVIHQMFSCPGGNQNQNMEGERHCILIGASNPYSLPTSVYQPLLQNPKETDAIETRTDNCLSDAEKLAKSFAKFAISLSIICPKQLPELRGIYNAGKRDQQAEDPPVASVKNPHFLVLISENFLEARFSLSGSVFTSLPSNPYPAKMDMISVPPVSGAPPASAPATANGSVLAQPPISVGNMPPATIKQEPTPFPTTFGSIIGLPSKTPMLSNIISSGTTTSVSTAPTVASVTGLTLQNSTSLAGLQPMNSILENMHLNQPTSGIAKSTQSKYVKVWEGNLCGLRRDEPVFITKLEGYRQASASERLAANWLPTMLIVHLISQDHIKSMQYRRKTDFLVFRALDQHAFLAQLQEMKLCGVIQLPSQILLLSVSDREHRLIGMLLPGDMTVFKTAGTKTTTADLTTEL